MAEKKLKNKFGASKPSEASKLSPKLIMDSAQHIWLAGLGAFAKAQEEGGKLFEALVREGGKLEEKTRKLTTAKVDEVRGVVEGAVGQAQKRATDSWDKLEKVFEGRVSKALEGLGVPSNDDIKTLSKRVEELSAMVKQLKSSDAKPAAKAAAKPVLRVVPTAKPVVAKAAPAAKAVPAKAVVAKKPAVAAKPAAEAKPVAAKPAASKPVATRVKAAVKSAEKRVTSATNTARKTAASVVTEIREIAQSLADKAS
jgi:poly(hydroxyalkanoate) granule-associated protein